VRLYRKPSCLIDSVVGGAAPTAERFKGPLSLPEVRIAIFYVMLASAWIIGSDVLLECLVGKQADTVFYQTFKGLNFVVTTGLLLYLVLRRAFGGWRRSEELRLACLHTSSERFRNLSARIQTLREEERTKISREIHDELGQLLTGTKMQLRLIEDRLADRNDRTLNPLIDDLVEVADTIDETIDSVRRISSGLRPLALDHLGLTAAMSEEANQFTRRTGIEVQVDMTEWETALPAEMETTAFRIFQESLTNVARHAVATRVEAQCKVTDDQLSLTIRDNGVGIDTAALDNPASLGLAGMLERAAAVGGKVEFSSKPGNGTEVALIIPLCNPIVPAGLKDHDS
jgi:signal transduction histidine kinase